jgi:hypothetical protein
VFDFRPLATLAIMGKGVSLNGSTEGVASFFYCR